MKSLLYDSYEKSIKKLVNNLFNNLDFVKIEILQQIDSSNLILKISNYHSI